MYRVTPTFNYPYENEAYDPVSDNSKSAPPIPLDLIPMVAARALRIFEIDTFRVVYKSAVVTGLVSEQEIKDTFGKDVYNSLKNERDPDPATCREILSFLSTRDPEKASGNKLPWRHSRCARAEEAPTPQG